MATRSQNPCTTMSLLASLLLLLLSTVSLLSAAGPDQNGGRQAASGGVLEVASEEALDRMVETWGGIVFIACREASTPMWAEQQGQVGGGGRGGGGGGGGDAVAEQETNGRGSGGGEDLPREREEVDCAARFEDLESAAAHLSDSGLDDSAAIVTARGGWASRRAAQGGGIVWLAGGGGTGSGYPAGRGITGRDIGMWARQMMALQEIGGRGDGGSVTACDACRASLEAIHSHWGTIAGDLVREGAVEILQGGGGVFVAELGQGEDAHARAVAALDRMCNAPGGRMVDAASDQVRKACGAIARQEKNLKLGSCNRHCAERR